MAEVIEFSPSEFDFSHVMCSDCNGTKFIVQVSEGEPPVWEFLICDECGSSIPVKMDPCFSASGG